MPAWSSSLETSSWSADVCCVLLCQGERERERDSRKEGERMRKEEREREREDSPLGLMLIS